MSGGIGAISALNGDRQPRRQFPTCLPPVVPSGIDKCPTQRTPGLTRQPNYKTCTTIETRVVLLWLDPLRMIGRPIVRECRRITSKISTVGQGPAVGCLPRCWLFVACESRSDCVCLRPPSCGRRIHGQSEGRDPCYYCYPMQSRQPRSCWSCRKIAQIARRCATPRVPKYTRVGTSLYRKDVAGN